MWRNFDKLCISFQEKQNALQTLKKFCAMYCEATVNYCMCGKWLKKFHRSNFNLSDVPHSRQTIVSAVQMANISVRS